MKGATTAIILLVLHAQHVQEDDLEPGVVVFALARWLAQPGHGG